MRMKYTSMQDITVRQIQPQETSHARRLILAGLREKWGELDLARNRDLDDIIASYQDGVFLVAISGSTVIGTGAFIPESERSARVVRMWTERRSRGQGVGRAILEGLLNKARSQGYSRVVLETTASWNDAVQFYRNRGFTPVATYGGDTHFELDLEEIET